MKQFNLSEYLENPSRKVVTRRGNPVRIICWDRQCELYNYPIIALVSVENTEVPVISNKEGKTWNNNEVNDLFFADEGDELTEFEKELKAMIQDVERCDFTDESFDFWKDRLLDLARKEIKEDWRTPLRLYKRAYEQGKQDVLKDLPKWKKATENKEFDKHVLLFEDEKRVVLTTELYKGDYYIELDSLKTLPKEE